MINSTINSSYEPLDQTLLIDPEVINLLGKSEINLENVLTEEDHPNFKNNSLKRKIDCSHSG